MNAQRLEADRHLGWESEAGALPCDFPPPHLFYPLLVVAD